MHAMAIAATLTAMVLQAPARPKEPAIWMMPPPWEGNGKCLRQLLTRDAEWAKTRTVVSGIGYWPWLLNVHFSDDEIRALFSKVREWGLPFSFEVPVVKKEWPTARETFDQLQGFMKRFAPLGARVDAFSFDEPLYAATRLVGKPEEYAVEQTAAYIADLRKAYPNASVCDIEPYPAVPLSELTSFVEKLQARCAAKGVRGIDTFRLDVDWGNMNARLPGSWTDVKKVETFCRARGVRFSLICWAADFPALKERGLANEMTWYVGVMHTAAAFASVGGAPDELVVESWLHTPSEAVPETSPAAFTRSVLDLAATYAPSGRRGK